MSKSEVYRVNYYVGAVLAQGGNIWLESSKVIFSPTSAIERAMGAKDVEIGFQEITELVFKGDLLRTFHIKTTDKTHKFEGGQAKKVWELLDKAIQTTKPIHGPHACEACGKPLEPCYSFCPFCATPVRSKCISCRRAIDPRWAACAFCGWKFAAKPEAT